MAQSVPNLLISCLAAILSASAWAAADDFSRQRLDNWHQWRGPEANGSAPRGDPPMRWDEQTNIKWKVPVPGQGTSTPIIWGDRVFLLTAIKTDRLGDLPPAPPPTPKKVEAKSKSAPKERPRNLHQFVVLCLDRNSGRTLWQRVAAETVPHQRHHNTSSHVASSPITDGRHVYFSFGSRGVYCYDLDGNQRWKADLGLLDIKFEFGEGSSPALHRDTLIVNCDHEGQSFATALDAATGRAKWKVLRDESSTWNTPLVAEHDGRAQVIINGARSARSYDLTSGALIWSHAGPAGVDAIPSPLRLGDLVILTSGFRGNPAYAIPLRSTGALTDEDLAWKHTGGTPQIATPVLVGERIYFIKDRLGVMTCLDARTCAVIAAQERLPLQGDVYPSPVAAAGRIYFTARNGGTAVIDATADGVRVLAENKLDETVVGSPAIAGREIFVRGDRSLYCLAEPR